ncbi:flagellar assembly protein FliH [Paenibacillus melissococcoides]|uniref:Flagellar assembly protein FliH n=1 Tax=Paenibacillus melissococcoides TaxID=2912268 RepID=A0ABN8U298_9BACL|nr:MULTISPECIES: FliH/SctL family protein [Paenibacillus]MEB9897878.1 FliH/SctL family protein [Bacillus cereus]CAH8243772.1 flagellar assembly protein FliH [Paenibacillus melissococcoides]CAH8704641.1 flagellar assembly protein FliH [Paenibacillus melissococcoides]CAH8707413.1 flagellar assembly protein FliH [Paenibacillus melissococcoides]GIO80591.1 flagellar assembly protein FliH [Paenibacillus dendritiformis]
MSNVIKSTQYVPLEQMRLIEAVRRHQQRSEEEAAAAPEPLTEETLLNQDEQLAELRQSILDDARSFAEEHLRQATEEAERMKEEAQSQIDAWWEERRRQDEQLIESTRSESYESGYREGMARAEQEIKEAYERKIAEAEAVLRQAYQAKEQLIQEAEPFVVSLSCAVAEKIIQKQLSVEPEIALELARKTLARKRESGTITLCVSPEQFAYVHAAREELSLAVDSQAELQIIPDSSVNDGGCVVRSALGSIDARIDTQLTEIKKALMQVAMQHEEQSGHDA